MTATLQVLLVALAAAPAGMVPVGPGERDGRAVVPFLLDRLPVTEGEMLAFVRAHPRWRRDRVPRLFADAGYLSHWAASDALGDAVGPRQPVVRVSWFAAKAYCEARGARLPTEDEWELAAAAGRRGPDGRLEPGHLQRILGWYARPTPARLPEVGGGAPDFHGVHDLHGLVWEWVFDFGASVTSGDSRSHGKGRGPLFCGAGAASAKDKDDYAAFMRMALRSSLEGRYTTANLGFRCARDLEETP